MEKCSKARYRGLLDTVPDAIVMVNNTGRIVLVNGQAEQLFGYQREELLGKPIEILLPQRFRMGHVVTPNEVFHGTENPHHGRGAGTFCLPQRRHRVPRRNQLKSVSDR